MVIVGLGGSGHEWSSCAFDRGRLHAISEERLCRRKYGLGADLLAAQSRKACLSSLGRTADDVSHVVACTLVPRVFYHGVRHKVSIINHHLAHAYSAFGASPFKAAAVLVADNSGSIIAGEMVGDSRTVETISMFDADEAGGIHLVQRVEGEHRLEAADESAYLQPGATANSLGHLYRTASLLLGFQFRARNDALPFSEDGKTMGLAPYGDDRFVDRVGELVDLLPEGQLRIPLDRVLPVLTSCLDEGSDEARFALASAVQHHVECALLHCASWLRERTGRAALCVAGGVGLNSVANGRLMREAGFDDVFVVPAPSDDGISLGCAYWGLHNLGGVPLADRPRLRDAYLGPERPVWEIDVALREHGLQASPVEDPVESVAEILAQGAIVGWFQGRSEFGPRALGHRSILAAPFPAAMRDTLNFEVKHREWFRPYGPIVPAEHRDGWFDCPGESPFMSFVAPVLKREQIPAATHVDGTGRLQTVRREVNPELHALLQAFGKRTSVPVLINTSFNHAGEPIVETAAEAIDAGLRMGLDMVVLDGRLVSLPGRRR